MENQSDIICQSCGMPMRKESDFGTKENGIIQKEYCHYCYQGGHFTDPDISLEDKINKNVQMAMGQGMSEKDAKKMANSTLPKLKRWQGQQSPQMQKTRLIVAIVTGFLFLTILAIYYFSGDAHRGDNNDKVNPISFLPIWIAVMIPIMVSQKNGPQKTTPQQKNLLIIILAMLLILGIATFLIFNTK